jgi:hypothetical protein
MRRIPCRCFDAEFRICCATTCRRCRGRHFDFDLGERPVSAKGNPGPDGSAVIHAGLEPDATSGR